MKTIKINNLLKPNWFSNAGCVVVMGLVREQILQLREEKEALIVAVAPLKYWVLTREEQSAREVFSGVVTKPVWNEKTRRWMRLRPGENEIR